MPAVPGFPESPEEARLCVHDNAVWFGHECGVCEDHGEYVWKQMSFEDAISYAIFAINTFMHPDASSPVDVERLETKSAIVISTLADIREAVVQP